MQYHPHPYQERATRHVLEHAACGLYLEMGLGKTAPTLTAMAELLDTCTVRRALVLAPLRVAEEVWPAEIRKWDHLRHMSFALLHGTPAQRARALRGREAVHLIHYGLLPWLVQFVGAARWPYDLVVLDESTRVKNRETKRWKALRKVRPRIHRIVQLTGTAAPNGLLDLWAPVYLLDAGERLFRTWGMYRSEYFRRRRAFEWVPRRDAVERVQAKLADICLAMRTEDYLQLPPLTTNVLRVTLPAAARAVYTQLAETLLLELTGAGVRELVAHGAARANKCLQAANGAVYHGEGARKWEPLHDAKLDALRDVVEEAAGEPVLVAYSYRSDRERLVQAFPHAWHISDPGAVAAWNAGRVPMLLAHPASAGHGLNLQHGGRVLAWYGLPWSLELFQQMGARLLRQGQTRPVWVHLIVARDTMDERVLDVLTGKATVQEALMAGLAELRRAA